MIEDKLRSVRNYYYNGPQWLKNIVGSAYGSLPMSIRLGSAYKVHEQLLAKSIHWSVDEGKSYQFHELLSTVTNAYNNIPFYRKLYDSNGVSPSDLKSLEDIEKFPIITKSDIKNNLADCINPKIPESSRLTTTTGGSTSEPMRFYQLKSETRPKERASICAGWSRVGYQYGDKAVQIKGRPVGQPQNNVFWEYEPIQNYLEMDSNHMTDKNLPLYIETIKDFNADFLIGFPSSLYLLAKFIKENNLTAPSFKAVMCASENVYDWQRTMLQDVFNCRIYSHYGHSEMILLGMESPSSTDLLFFPTYGFLEILDTSNKPLCKVGDKGELVGTSFHNPVMPFIRYKTQDIGTIGESDKNFPAYPVLSSVEGRLQEFLVTKNRRLISICTMGAAHFDTLDNVSETQYYQEEPGKIEFHVVAKKQYSKKDENKIYSAVKHILGDDTELKVKQVDAIKRTKSGKHMMLVQKIDNVPLYEKAMLKELI